MKPGADKRLSRGETPPDARTFTEDHRTSRDFLQKTRRAIDPERTRTGERQRGHRAGYERGRRDGQDRGRGQSDHSGAATPSLYFAEQTRRSRGNDGRPRRTQDVAKLSAWIARARVSRGPPSLRGVG